MDGYGSSSYICVMDAEGAVGLPGRPREFCVEKALTAALAFSGARGTKVLR